MLNASLRGYDTFAPAENKEEAAFAPLTLLYINTKIVKSWKRRC
jgi:hypothetical protein